MSSPGPRNERSEDPGLTSPRGGVRPPESKAPCVACDASATISLSLVVAPGDGIGSRACVQRDCRRPCSHGRSHQRLTNQAGGYDSFPPVRLTT